MRTFRLFKVETMKGKKILFNSLKCHNHKPSEAAKKMGTKLMSGTRFRKLKVSITEVVKGDSAKSTIYMYIVSRTRLENPIVRFKRKTNEFKIKYKISTVSLGKSHINIGGQNVLLKGGQFKEVRNVKIMGAGPIGLILALQLLDPRSNKTDGAYQITMFEKYNPGFTINSNNNLIVNMQMRNTVSRKQVFFLKDSIWNVFPQDLKDAFQPHICFHGNTPDTFKSFNCGDERTGGGVSMEIRIFQLTLLTFLWKNYSCRYIDDNSQGRFETTNNIIGENKLLINFGKVLEHSDIPPIYNQNFSFLNGQLRSILPTLVFNCSGRTMPNTNKYSYKICDVSSKEKCKDKAMLFLYKFDDHKLKDNGTTLEWVSKGDQEFESISGMGIDWMVGDRRDSLPQFDFRIFPSKIEGGRLYLAMLLTDKEYEMVKKTKTFRRETHTYIISILSQALQNHGISPLLINWYAENAISSFPVDLHQCKKAVVISNEPANPFILYNIGDAAFSAHFFTYSGVNNGLEQVKWLFEQLTKEGFHNTDLINTFNEIIKIESAKYFRYVKTISRTSNKIRQIYTPKKEIGSTNKEMKALHERAYERLFGENDAMDISE